MALQPETGISQNTNNVKRKRVNWLSRFGGAIVRSRPLMLIILIVLLSAYMLYWYPISFPTFSNISAVLLNASQDSILVVGMMILMIGGQFDLSIGGILALSGVVTGVLIAQVGLSTPLAVLIGLAVGAFTGLVNGFAVTKLRINALIATLATQGIFYGVTQLISGTGVSPIGTGFAKLGQTFIIGFESPFWVMLVVVVLGSLAVSKTRFFRQYYFIGGNDRAAKLSGIKVEKVTMIGFVLMGLLAALSGILGAARLNAAVVSAGIGVELNVITAAVLGGASLKGGEGVVIGGVLGVIFIDLVQNALIIMGVGVFWQNIIIGLVLLFAVSFDRLKSQNRV